MLRNIGPRFNFKCDKTAKERAHTASKDLLCQSPGSCQEKLCPNTWDGNIWVDKLKYLKFPDFHDSSDRKSGPFPLAREKNFTMAGSFANTSPESGVFQDNAFFCVRSATTSFIASGITGKITFLSLGGNSSYNQNNYRTRIKSTGNNWKNMHGSVPLKCSNRVVVKGRGYKSAQQNLLALSSLP